MQQLTMLQPAPDLPQTIEERARLFCEHPPHRRLPFSKRNWGGQLHSLCSYQGKLKPAIAHFLVAWFTQPGSRVLDPLCGVGTIPLEARRLGRVGIGNDLSPLAVSVTRAKLEPFTPEGVARLLDGLEAGIEAGPTLRRLTRDIDVEFGLNGRLVDYFHPQTLREILVARRWLADAPSNAEADVVRSSVAHLLHGNRPYALSRRSHPVTPFAPTGPVEYRPLMGRLRVRLDRVVPELLELTGSPAGIARSGDFRDLREVADAVVTSPPFADSVRFWSMNWMRLWFMGWEPDDFRSQPARYLESEQRHTFAPYEDLAESLSRQLRSGGVLVMHLGETASVNMATAIVPILEPWFDILHVGREDVEATESHGLTDKGSTRAHWYVFARRGT